MNKLLLVMFLCGSTIILNINIANLIPDYYDMVLFLVLTAVTFPMIWFLLLAPLYMDAKLKLPNWGYKICAIYMTSATMFCFYKISVILTENVSLQMSIWFALTIFFGYYVTIVYPNPREIK